MKKSTDLFVDFGINKHVAIDSDLAPIWLQEAPAGAFEEMPLSIPVVGFNIAMFYLRPNMISFKLEGHFKPLRFSFTCFYRF